MYLSGVLYLYHAKSSDVKRERAPSLRTKAPWSQGDLRPVRAKRNEIQPFNLNSEVELVKQYFLEL